MWYDYCAYWGMWNMAGSLCLLVAGIAVALSDWEGAKRKCPKWHPVIAVAVAALVLGSIGLPMMAIGGLAWLYGYLGRVSGDIQALIRSW